MLLTLELLLILACLFYGARKGGVALGLLGGIGVVILLLVLEGPPSPRGREEGGILLCWGTFTWSGQKTTTQARLDACVEPSATVPPALGQTKGVLCGPGLSLERNLDASSSGL
ncbi:MAG TPA: hypothetical protein DHV85_25465 [Candidatus Accumulibacter sp.]|nr:hypothetical protein [Accumulibacter sp.]